MNSKKMFLVSALSLALAASPAAMAQQAWPDHGRGSDRGASNQGRGDHDGRGRGPAPHHDQRANGHGPPSRHDQHDNRYQSDRRHDSRDNGYRHAPRQDRRGDDGWRGGDRERHWSGDRHRAGRYYAPRGYEHRRWHHGDYVPVSYRSHRYVVDDYRAYRLYAPPHGHSWVRVDNDVVLTAVATGVIAAVVYGIFQ